MAFLTTSAINPRRVGPAPGPLVWPNTAGTIGATSGGGGGGGTPPPSSSGSGGVLKLGPRKQ